MHTILDVILKACMPWGSAELYVVIVQDAYHLGCDSEGLYSMELCRVVCGYSTRWMPSWM